MREQEELKKIWVGYDHGLDFTGCAEDKSVFSGLSHVGGVDVSFLENDDHRAIAALVVLEYPSLKVGFCVE